jgi:signal transduction histidine kinase
MKKSTSKTEYAPAESDSKESIDIQSKGFRQNQLLTNIANAVSQMLLILNKKRQIIYANNAFIDFLELPDSSTIIGRRLGGVLNCVNASKCDGGCGTSEFCRTCGAINAILESQLINHSEKECRILTQTNDAYDLRVTANLFFAADEPLTIFTLIDISNEKRKQTLERSFFHDVLNSAGGIAGLSGLMPEISDPDEILEVAGMIYKASENLINEIQLQKYLSAAENGTLEVEYNEFYTKQILNEVLQFYVRNEIVEDINLVIKDKTENISLVSDSNLVRKIIGSMVKNALEASEPGSTITLACVKTNDIVRFSVHNNIFIPLEIQNQIFHRSFSTKGTGRGIGTYSMKLLGEKYLKGKVGFDSNEEKGTTFFIDLIG